MGQFCPTRIGIALTQVFAFPAIAAANAPLNFLSAYGASAKTILPLTWAVLIISVAVIVIITALTLLGIWRRGDSNIAAIGARPSDTNAAPWLYIGVGISSVVLVAALVLTIRTLNALERDDTAAALTIEVTGQQWWWKVRYLSDDPTQVLTTANEIHIPTGQRVRLRLIAPDVIHSFWVPALGGKTDMIPGQTNLAWLEADHVGRYRGQCSEYCGVQHAHMSFEVVAQPPEEFRTWLQTQLQAAQTPDPGVADGARAFENYCGACHTIRGTAAGGTTGPDLTHLMSRASLAALTIRNSPGDLEAWIADPQKIKPGNHMPTLQLSAQEASDLSAFLVTLR